MKKLLVVGEDALCGALGIQLIRAAMPGWIASGEPINTGGITKLLPSIARYVKQAQYVWPVLCVADTDKKCPVELRNEWLPPHAPNSFMFRLAVPEAESWVLADREAFAEFFRVPINKITAEPEKLADAKVELLRLARMSKVRSLKEEVVSATSPVKRGVGYNTHLCALVYKHWDAIRAAERAPSLSRAIERLHSFAANEAQ
ncbi:MAG: hypothetical protein MUF76_11745 [Hydrogenophaga sp.]|nr:hypothetical protein [Hydrogenophaga sp.]